MVTYGPKIDPEQLGDSLLIEPKGLGFIEDLDSDRPRLGLVQNEIPFIGLFGFVHTFSCGFESSYRANPGDRMIGSPSQARVLPFIFSFVFMEF
jgi:hypothetical protein